MSNSAEVKVVFQTVAQGDGAAKVQQAITDGAAPIAAAIGPATGWWHEEKYGPVPEALAESKMTFIHST